MKHRIETNHRSVAWTGLAVVGMMTAVLSLSGCGGEEPPPPVVQAQPAPPPPPPPPKVKTVQELMAELNIDPRVDLPEGRAPATTADRRAVLEFFDAMARGDSDSLKSMMSEPDRDALTAMVSTGVWKSATGGIQKVRIQTGPNPQSGGAELCALAVIETGEAYQPQLWSFVSNPDGTATFRANATPPSVMNRLSGDDWIVAWFRILEEELLLAQKPDEDITTPKVARTEDDEKEEKGGGGALSTGGGGGGGKRKVKDKIRAPKFP